MTNGWTRHGGRQETYNRALHVLARMRRSGASLTAASREEHIDPRTVRKYVGTDVRGRGRPSKADRRRRDMLIPTTIGNAPITVRGSKQASQLGRYMSAVSKYLRAGDTDGLAEFEGQTVAGHAVNVLSAVPLNILSKLRESDVRPPTVLKLR